MTLICLCPQTHKNMNANVAGHCNLSLRTLYWVISEFNKEFVQVECKVDEAQTKAGEVHWPKLKANKAKWEQKHHKDNGEMPQRQGEICKDKKKCCKTRRNLQNKSKPKARGHLAKEEEQ